MLALVDATGQSARKFARALAVADAVDRLMLK
jgi:hypothetical protein